jgi:hypothetical protein
MPLEPESAMVWGTTAGEVHDYTILLARPITKIAMP